VGTSSFSGAVLRLNDLRYLLKSGGTMTGALIIQPTSVRQKALNLVGSGSYTLMSASGGSIIHTPRGNLSLLGNYSTVEQVSGVAVAGRYVYAVDLSGGFRIIDATNPQSPTLMSSLSLGGFAYKVAISGRYAYVTNGANGLRIIDISNPVAPAVVGTQVLNNAYGLYVAGRYAYVAGQTSGLEIVDISNPHSPVLVGTIDTPSLAYGVTVAGRYAYVADYTSGIHVVDVMNPRSPKILGTYVTTKAYGVVVVGRYAYIADDSSGLRIVDVSDPSSPNWVSTLSTGGNALAITVAGRYAYVTNSAKNISVIDISIPTAPKLSGTFNSTGIYQDIAVSGRIAYVPDSTIGGVALIDLNGLDTPTATIGTLEAGALSVLSNSHFDANLTVHQALSVGAGLSVLGQTSMRALSGSALILSTMDKTGLPTLTVSGSVVIGTGSTKGGSALHVVGTISGSRLIISGTGGFSGAIIVRQTAVRGSGALVVDQRSTGTGVYIRGSYVATNGNRSPLLALDSGTASSLAPHILFGYKGSFDVSMFRSGSGALTIASSTGKTLTLDAGRTDATGNIFEIFSDYSTTNNKVFRVQANDTTQS
jgi:hypothetical protein